MEGARLVILEINGEQVDTDQLTWKKPTRSGPLTDNCVEATIVGDTVLVRNSRNPNGGVLQFTADEWVAFIGGAQDGDFDFGLMGESTQ